MFSLLLSIDFYYQALSLLFFICHRHHHYQTYQYVYSKNSQKNYHYKLHTLKCHRHYKRKYITMIIIIYQLNNEKELVVRSRSIKHYCYEFINYHYHNCKKNHCYYYYYLYRSKTNQKNETKQKKKKKNEKRNKQTVILIEDAQ